MNESGVFFDPHAVLHDEPRHGRLADEVDVGSEFFAGQHLIGRDLLRVGLNGRAALRRDLLPAMDRLARNAADRCDVRQ
jgi:hypothetical protein